MPHKYRSNLRSKKQFTKYSWHPTGIQFWPFVFHFHANDNNNFSGMGKHIASFTVSSILQTFSNNDYLNIISYNNTVKFVVPCFKNRLVQATKENIEVFMNAVVKLQPDEKSNLVDALKEAFKLLSDVCLQNILNNNLIIDVMNF